MTAPGLFDQGGDRRRGLEIEIEAVNAAILSFQGEAEQQLIAPRDRADHVEFRLKPVHRTPPGSQISEAAGASLTNKFVEVNKQIWTNTRHTPQPTEDDLVNLPKIAAGCLIFGSYLSAAQADPACIKSGQRAVQNINKALAIMIDNTTVECTIAPDIATKSDSSCSLICASMNDMTKDQRRAILVWLVGTIGKEVNDKRLGRVGTINYLDRGLANSGYGLAMPLDTAASLQHLAHTDQINAMTLIAAVESGFKKKSTKVH